MRMARRHRGGEAATREGSQYAIRRCALAREETEGVPPGFARIVFWDSSPTREVSEVWEGSWGMEDALYWTASTIAQTLSGAMGILAAFVLYRLSQLARKVAHFGPESASAQQEKQVKKWLWIALLSSAGCIAFALGLLPWGGAVARSGILAYVLTCACVLFAFWCLLSYLILIRMALK